MSRKTEKILAWIANGLSALYLIIMALSLVLFSIPETRTQISDVMKQQGQQLSTWCGCRRCIIQYRIWNHCDITT